MSKVKSVVIPVGGLGTRFLPATKEIPKEMFPIVDKPTIQYIVEEAIESGIENIIFVSSPTKGALSDHFDVNPGLELTLKEKGKDDILKSLKELSKKAKFITIRQGTPEGSAKAVYQAKEIIKSEPFAVMYGDDLMKYPVSKPVLGQLIELYDKTNSNIIGVTKVDPKDVYKYGIIEYADKETGKIKSIVEKPKVEEAPSNFAGVGRYILDSKIFEIIEGLGRGAGGEFQLTDAMKKLMDLQDFYACNFDGQYLDCGSKIGMIIAGIEFGVENPEIREQLLNYMDKKVQSEKVKKLV